MFKIIGADGREYGPVETAQLRAWIKEGRVDGKTLALAENGTEWKPLSAFPEFTFVAAVTPPTLTAPIGVTPNLMRTNGFAIAGMTLGIVSLTLCFCCYGGFPCNLLAFIFSLIALSQIKQNPNVYTGRGMAMTGLILSLVSFGLAICFMLSGAFFELWNPERIQRELNLH